MILKGLSSEMGGGIKAKGLPIVMDGESIYNLLIFPLFLLIHLNLEIKSRRVLDIHLGKPSGFLELMGGLQSHFLYPESSFSICTC